MDLSMLFEGHLINKFTFKTNDGPIDDIWRQSDK